MRSQEKSLGELLIRAGRVGARQVQEALEEQKKTKEPLGRVLVRLGFVREADILSVLEGMTALTFRTGGELFALETLWIQEVLRFIPWQSPSSLHAPWAGTLALRGLSRPVLSFRRVLGLEELPQAGATWYIALRGLEKPFLVWVDEVREVKRFRLDQMESTPSQLIGRNPDLYFCLARMENDLYSVLDPSRLARLGEDPRGREIEAVHGDGA